MRRCGPKLLLGLIFCSMTAVSAHAIAPSIGFRQEVTPDRIAKQEQAATASRVDADNAWMLSCSALVPMMTGPGLALLYGGLVRRKNVLATMMQSFAMMAIITVTWAFLSYSLARPDLWLQAHS